MDDWRFVAAGDWDFHRWSFGRIKRIEDLYDPKIFGPTENCRCECGKYNGAKYVGIICDRCGVKIAADVAHERRCRTGHIELARWCRHPVDAEHLIQEFAVCPVGFRVEPDGRPNTLGLRFENLIRLNDAARAKLPAEGSEDYFDALLDLDPEEIETELRHILGIQARGQPPAPDGLLGLLFDSVRTLDPAACHLARSCGLAIEIEATL